MENITFNNQTLTKIIKVIVAHDQQCSCPFQQLKSPRNTVCRKQQDNQMQKKAKYFKSSLLWSKHSILTRLNFLPHQIVKRRAAVAPIEKRIRHQLVHRVGEVSSVPVDVLGRVGAGGGGRGSARVEYVEVVGAAAVAAAGLVALLKAVFCCIL